MSELQTELRRCLLVHEGHDASPGIALSLVPKARASRSDASFRGHAGHLGIEQTRAAKSAVPVVNEMPVAGNPVGCAVLRHRGNHDPVRELQLPKSEGQKHRGRCAVDTAARGKPALMADDKLRIAQLEVLMTDALATGQ